INPEEFETLETDKGIDLECRLIFKIGVETCRKVTGIFRGEVEQFIVSRSCPIATVQIVPCTLIRAVVKGTGDPEPEILIELIVVSEFAIEYEPVVSRKGTLIESAVCDTDHSEKVAFLEGDLKERLSREGIHDVISDEWVVQSHRVV